MQARAKKRHYGTKGDMADRGPEASGTMTLRTKYVPKAWDASSLDLLSEITHLLLRDAPPNQVCETIFQKLRSVLRLDAYFHFRVTPDGARLKLACSGGCPPERLAEIEFLNFGDAVCGTVAVRRRQMYVPRIPECVDRLTQFVYSIGITCYTCQPLIVNDRLLGTLSFGTRRRSEYSEQELQLLRLVCDQIAIAMAREEARTQQAELERIAVAGQVAAKIAHEIANPLSAANNLLFLLGSLPLSQAAKEYLTMAQEQLDRVAEISRRTLSFYRKSCKLMPVNLSHAIDNVLVAAAFTAGKKQLRFQVDVARDVQVRVIDCELAQILTNLVANAIHYSPEREAIRIAALDHHHRVELFVSDEGPGVSAENAAHLFQPFFTTNKENGNGLGLWISRELARRSGGDLLLATSPKGATFKLLLQAAN